ncbi:hypothetical protein O3M35_006637 [Rhynocoris fuscipes]|uniref:Uncharacterized protein n=1 Tax=Rhynocoris fuscipes TaxID=488301 RepID=A0AAW1DGK4_9HEMI
MNGPIGQPVVALAVMEVNTGGDTVYYKLDAKVLINRPDHVIRSHVEVRIFILNYKTIYSYKLDRLSLSSYIKIH